ncbi:hypothetical protein MUK42_08695 [Musa troglodytarum]|uniref:Uncharacterized protein n=1 Tax=Musa troglodytarum TaxID=320322 RepID=A0A9E7EFU4_9LILI|nr:hypothetical protein MUK42_08695 [Musa troglodytarum]
MASRSAFPSLSPTLRRSVALTKTSLPIRKPSTFRRNPTLLPIKALKEWREYEDALREKDLARALRFLRSMELEPLPAEESSVDSVSYVPADYPRTARDWEVLDACLNADDMRLVGSAYAFLQDRGFLPNFGKFKNIVLEGPREVTLTVLKESTGLEASKLAPKKWGISGSSRLLLIGFLGAYLMGCPIRGVILDPIVAMQMGIQGQAGTQFWDEKLDNELAEGRLSSTAFDRYCMVLFAGIAAEVLVYGEAEGGENDENLFRSLCVLLRPPLTVMQVMSNQARRSVMQSYNLLKWHKNAHKAAVKALESGHSLGVVIRRIEEAMSSGN